MASDRPEIPPLEDLRGHLERELIDQFLRSQGYGRADLDKLPDERRQNLLKDASTYAASRLTEIESRSHYLHEIHGGVEGTHKIHRK